MCFFLILVFWTVRGGGGGGGGLEVKRQKVAQNENYKLHVSHFLVHIQEYSSFFKNSGFFGVLWGSWGREGG